MIDLNSGESQVRDGVIHPGYNKLKLERVRLKSLTAIGGVNNLYTGNLSRQKQPHRRKNFVRI